MSPDKIVYHHPSITLANIHAALAYYYDHIEEIRQQIRQSEASANQLATEIPSILKQQLEARNARADINFISMKMSAMLLQKG